MAEVYDILLDDDLDLAPAKNGDFAVGESTGQHQNLLLLSEKGMWRQHPLTGVGIASALLDDSPGAIKREILKEFELDGMRVKKVRISPQNINVAAEYE